jgi:small GTP-binding protein
MEGDTKEENNNTQENGQTQPQQEEGVYLASEKENPENKNGEAQDTNENEDQNEINYKNLLNYDPKMKIEILDNKIGDKYDINFKIIVIGNSGVGKSSLTIKATTGIFKEEFSSTLGFQFFSFHVKINDKIIKLQIWDTCGQEIYRSLITNFYRSSALALICYSVNDIKSFEEIEIWLKQVKMNSDPDCKVFLIANKIDLPDRVVTTEQGIDCKKEHDFECYMETSAKTGVNVKELFVNCALALYKELPKYIKQREILENERKHNQFNLNDEGIKSEESDCAC